MDENIFKQNKYINEYEKKSYDFCQTKEGLLKKMIDVKEINNHTAAKAIYCIITKRGTIKFLFLFC